MLLQQNNFNFENSREENKDTVSEKDQQNAKLNNTQDNNKSFQQLSEKQHSFQEFSLDKKMNKTSIIPTVPEKLPLQSTNQTSLFKRNKDCFLLKSNLTKENDFSFNEEENEHYKRTDKSNNTNEEVVPSDIRFSNESITSTTTYREMHNYFTSLYFSREREFNEVEVTKSNKKCCLFRLFDGHEKFQLEGELQKESNFYLFISKLTCELNDKKHFNIFKTIFMTFHPKILEKKEDLNVNELDNYYNKIIKTTNTKITIFSLLLIMALLDKHPSFIKEKYEIQIYDEFQMYDPVSFFIFLDLLSTITLNIIKESILNIYIIRNKNVTNTINEFFFGLIYLSTNDFNISSFSLTNNDNLYKQIYNYAKEKPTSVLWKYNFFKEKYPEVRDSVSGSLEKFQREESEQIE